MNFKIFIISVIVLIADQLTKIISEMFLKFNESITVIKDFFYLTLCHNDGIAWGFFSNKLPLIIILSLIALLIIYHFIYCFKRNTRNDIAFGLIIGGLAGNLLDRIIFGYVRDFLDFMIFNYDYPVFNVADIAVVIGVLLITLAILKGEDLSGDSSKRRKDKTR